LAGKLLSRANPYTWMDSIQYMRNFVKGSKRRQGWFLENLTIRKAVNMAVTGVQFALKSERLSTVPVAVKIDISPMCNLSCTVCVHADPNGNPGLEKQHFDPKHRMSVAQYRRIIDRIKGRASAVSLYYLGDPLVHPDMDEMSRIAREAGLNVHISTNFSFALTDARIKRIVHSGLTHMSVCVDGLSQEKYEMTRVGGRIDRVLHNLERVCHFRNEAGMTYPRVEVQYIKFQHNVDELEPARERLTKIGIDQFTDFWGGLGNYTDGDPDLFDVHAPLEPKAMPRCYWPYSSIVVKYNGDVIPCCSFRLGMQYTKEDDARVFGNVFKTSLTKIWNNRHYREARRLASNPLAVDDDPSLTKHFCYACPALFSTTIDRNIRLANKHRHEDLYDMGPDGRPIRKDGTVTGLPDARRNEMKVSQIGLPNGEAAIV
jgi:MoaA/NifB/PqqE/SkfB family radical SAM enzyme